MTEREIERHVQIATTAFDERMREIREEAATRLSRELDRAVELLTREELSRRLDDDGAADEVGVRANQSREGSS